MSANRSSPTIGKTSRLYAISSHCLAALPAKMSAFNRCMRQNAYHGDLTCIFEDLLPCDCYATKANSRTTRSRISQPASAGKEAVLVNCKLITAWYYQNSEPGFCAVWVSLRQINVIARINARQMSVLLPLQTPMLMTTCVALIRFGALLKTFNLLAMSLMWKQTVLST